MFSMISSTARAPIAAIGCRTVVNSGHTIPAMVSSKPTTEMSCDTLSPLRWTIDITPAAISSLLAKIAVIFRSWDRI